MKANQTLIHPASTTARWRPVRRTTTHHPAAFKTAVRVLFAIAVAGMAACSSRPIVDMKGVDPAKYDRDLAECESYGRQVNVGGKAAAGAVGGAVVGAVFGAVVGNHETAQRTAGAGGVLGSAKGTGRGLNEREQVVRNCMRNRGYVVLN